MLLWPIPAKRDLDETPQCVSSTLVANCKKQKPVPATPVKQHLKTRNVFSLLLRTLTEISQDLNQLLRQQSCGVPPPL